MTRTFADLHMHTVASDGTDTVDERVEQANERELEAIAITDHDTLTDELDDRYEVRDGVEVITGAEIKAGLDGTKVEVLGYLLDPSDDRLADVFETIERYRTERMEAMIERVNTMIDDTVTFDEVRARADATIGRPHLARTLVEKGATDSVGDAFAEYIGEGCHGYVETEKLDAEEVIEVIHDNGGVASLAHPGRSLSPEYAEEQLGTLVEAGLDAIEVPYTYDRMDEDRYSFGAETAKELAEAYDLLVTGGSDCHGSDSDKFFLGDVRLPYRHVEALKERAATYRD